MTSATQILKNEHRLIEKVLGALELIARRAEVEGQLDQAAAGEAIEFLRELADRCHHGKEERHLFAALETKGFSRQAGPVAAMLHDHDQGRAHLRAMAEALKSGAGPGPETDRFAHQALAYVALLRAHILKEDQILFPMADQLLSAAEQSALRDQFERVEREDMGEGTHQRLHALAEHLLERVSAQAAGC